MIEKYQLTNDTTAPISSIYCIGRNYVAHIEELGNSRPDMPIIFSKPQTALNFTDTITLPTISNDVHFETELVVLIGKGGKNISEADALTHVGGYGIGLDLTAREIQAKLQKNGWPWELAKGFDGSAAISKFVPADTFSDVANIHFSMDFNGKRRQNGHTANMIFPITFQIAFLSRYFTLREGDILFTGTPEGVGKLTSGDKLALALYNDDGKAIIQTQYVVV